MNSTRLRDELSRACQDVNDVILEVQDCKAREKLRLALEEMESLILASLS